MLWGCFSCGQVLALEPGSTTDTHSAAAGPLLEARQREFGNRQGGGVVERQVRTITGIVVSYMVIVTDGETRELRREE